MIAGAVDTARGRRWGWFMGFVIAALPTNAAGIVIQPPPYVLFENSLLNQLLSQGGAFDPWFSSVVSIVIAAMPLVPLLYSFAAREDRVAPQYVVTSEPPVGPNDVTQP